MEVELALLRQLADGDTTVLEALIARFTPYVFSVLRRTLGLRARAEDVEELASDVFLALWQHRKRLRTAHLRGWLSRVAENKARSWLRRQHLDTVSSEEWVELPDTRAVLLEDEASRRLLAEDALSLLDPETREIFRRFYGERQTVNEIAEALGWKAPTVKSRLQRGRKQLKRELEQGG